MNMTRFEPSRDAIQRKAGELNITYLQARNHLIAARTLRERRHRDARTRRPFDPPIPQPRKAVPWLSYLVAGSIALALFVALMVILPNPAAL